MLFCCQLRIEVKRAPRSPTKKNYSKFKLSSRVYNALRQVILIAFIGKKKILNSSSKANSCTKYCNTKVRFAASVNPGNHAKIKDCWNQSTLQSFWSFRLSELSSESPDIESIPHGAKGGYGKLAVSGVGHLLRVPSD